MRLLKYLLLLVILILAISPSSAAAQSPTPQDGSTIDGDQVIVGNTFKLKSGETLQGSLLIIGGTASTETSSVINGDVVLVGGTVAIDGVLNGDVVAIGGAVSIKENATVNGDLTLVRASLQRAPEARINGSVSEQNTDLFNFGFSTKEKRWGLPFSNANPLASILNATLQALGMGILAIIIGLLLPKQIKRVSKTLTREPLVAGGVGLLTIILTPIILVLLIITILLIPVAIIAIIVLSIALLFGLIAVGYEVGERFSGVFKATWHPSISAGIGTLLLSLVIGFANLIPCVGWLLGLIAGILGLGAVVISRFGSEKYAPKLVQAVLTQQIVPEQPEPPQPPAE